MSDHLPKEVRDGLELARRADRRKNNRLRLHVGDAVLPVLRAWEDGFALSLEDAPRLRGLVDLYDGSRHLSRCLIVASSEETHEMVYEFKRATEAVDRQPLDFERLQDAPIALLAK